MSNTIESIEKGNLLIAEFMGMKHTKTVFDSHNYEQYNYTMPEELSLQVYGYKGAECFLEEQFSKSWDWLMPVIQKAKLIRDNIKGLPFISNKDEAYALSFLDMPIYSEINKVWQYLVEFIEWYNNQKSNQ